MKILIVHMRFHPDLTGTGPLVTDLATDLVAMGDEVTVVTSMPHYGQRNVPSEYRGRLLHREKYLGVKVWRTFVYVPPNPSGFHRGINYLSYTFMSVFAGVLSGRHDIIFCVNPPITVSLPGFLVRLARRTPMIFNVQDIWPDCLVIIGQLRNRVLVRTFQYLEKFVYRVSARITVLSEGMKENLMRKGVRRDKIVVIPNWADVDYIHPVPKENNFRAVHNLSGRFVVMFAGNLGYISVLHTVLEAAKLLQDKERIIFPIIGEGNAKSGLVERAKALGLSNVRFLPTQAKEVLPEMLGAADVSLVTLNRHLGQLNVPSKIYSIMASGRPVLAAVPDDSEIARLIKEAACGVWVRPEDPECLAQAVESLSKQPELLECLGANGRNYVAAHFGRRLLIRRYHQLLHQVACAKA